MFFNCSSLIELNIINFNIKNETDTNSMFESCSAKIKISEEYKYILGEDEESEDY